MENTSENKFYYWLHLPRTKGGGYIFIAKLYLVLIIDLDIWICMALVTEQF